MNRWILAAGILSGTTFIAHVFGGGIDVHQPLLQSSISTDLKAIVSVIWHMISILIFFNTLALFIAVRRAEFRTALIWLVSSHYLATGVIFIFYGLLRLGTVWSMPQWTVFFLIPVLAFIGMRKENQTEQSS